MVWQTVEVRVSNIRLLTQPGAGVGALIEAIDNAAEVVKIVIFRFDRGDIEMALKRAARRGVYVHALVAHTTTGQGGERMLRKLEMSLLADGITVTRTATDLVRYHDKLLLIDNRLLFMLGFNFTYLDTERSRSFGIVSDDQALVREADRLIQADATRQTYTPETNMLVVSPGNSRKLLLELLSSAEKQLLIYDGKLTDPDAMRVIAAKVRSGVDVRVLGAMGRRASGVSVARLHMRLHAQAIVRDGEQLFLGSQSLRTLELDARREVGILITDANVAAQIAATFEADWAKSTGSSLVLPALPPEIDLQLEMEPREISPAITAQLIKSAVKEAIKDAVIGTLQQSGDVIPLKSAVRDAAKEALTELAL